MKQIFANVEYRLVRYLFERVRSLVLLSLFDFGSCINCSHS